MPELPPFRNDAADEPSQDGGGSGSRGKVLILAVVVALLLVLVGLHPSGIVGPGR